MEPLTLFHQNGTLINGIKVTKEKRMGKIDKIGISTKP